PAIEHDLVTLLPVGVGGGQHRTGEIYARDEWKASHDGSLSRDGETILVIDGRRLHGHGDITGHQILLGQLDHLDGLLPVLVTVHQDGFETVGHLSSRCWSLKSAVS